MPELTKEDVAAFSLVKIRAELTTRHEWLEGKRKETEGKLVSLEGEDGSKAAAYFRELNILGERSDELAPIEEGEQKIIGLGDWLNGVDPANDQRQALLHPQGKSVEIPDWKDATDLILASSGYENWKTTGVRNFAVEMTWDALFGMPGDIVKSQKVLGLDDSLAGVDAEFTPQFIRIPGVQVPVLFQSQNMAPTFLQGTTDQNAVPYMVETVTSEGAVEVLEGGAKSAADIAFAEASTPVENIAVTLQSTNQLLEDIAFMRSWIEGRLRLFVGNREDLQLIEGDGTPPNLTGILIAAGTNAGSFGIAAHATDNTVGVDEIYNGIVAIREAFLDASTIGMAAATWAVFQLAKDGNSMYLLGGPAAQAPARLWGLPIVQNEKFPAYSAANEAIAVWSREAAMVVRRNQITLAVSDSHASTFSANVLTFRAEQRVAFPIFRPAGITVITTAA